MFTSTLEQLKSKLSPSLHISEDESRLLIEKYPEISEISEQELGHILSEIESEGNFLKGVQNFFRTHKIKRYLIDRYGVDESRFEPLEEIKKCGYLGYFRSSQESILNRAFDGWFQETRIEEDWWSVVFTTSPAKGQDIWLDLSTYLTDLEDESLLLIDGEGHTAGRGIIDFHIRLKTDGCRISLAFKIEY